MNGTEVLGEIVDGGLTARAVEPFAGEADGHNEGAACLNCAAPLIGSHCHACGQAAHIHRSIGALFHDLAHGVFHFEGKIWRTLPLLVWHPGRLTREYIDGRRASYVSPIALFLFCMFLMFAVVKQVGFDLSKNATVSVNGRQITGLAANQAELSRLQQARKELVARRQSTAAIDGEIAGRLRGISIIEAMRDPASAPVAVEPSDDSSSGIPALDAAIDKARANPQLMVLKLQSDAYKFAWLLIPISVPFVWLLFAFKRRFGAYDHTVFVTYSLCFMLLLLTAATLGNAAGIAHVMRIFVVISAVHIYRQVKISYELGRFAAIWRTAAIGVFAIWILGGFAILMMIMAGT